jgi:formate hydrogenlyase subunit 3/multisubunit Na+/H+ antiporter MnhD subunit
VNAWLRLGLLEAAALLTVVLVWRSARSQAAKLTYLAVVLISAGSMIASDLLADRGASDWARALLFTSVCIKLAAVPLFFWLLKLADELPALVLGLIIAVVDMAAFGEFFAAAQASPFVLTPQPLWVYVAVGTSLVAALLMLTQRSLKRLLVLSTAEDVGFLLLGAASMSVIGTQGALVAAATHSLAKALLFICLAGPESAGELETEPVALAARYPVSAFGFLFGMLAMLGVPPTLGFIGRWRLYSTALQLGPVPLTLFILSSIFALIAYALALSHNWWGPPNEAAPPPENAPPPERSSNSAAREPFALKATIVVLAVLLVAAGVWPSAWQFLLGVRP